MKISIIIPTYNEAESIEETITNLHKTTYNHEYEIIIADGGSNDDTILISSRLTKVVETPKGKPNQLNAAAKEASGEILFFVHADMFILPDTLSVIYRYINEEGYGGGGFANEFDTHNEKIKRLGTLMNFRFIDKREQSDKKIFYGDNGIFVKKSVFEELGGFKDIPIMEDYDFSVRMKNLVKVIQIKEPKIIVSARRHIKAGFLKTRLQWVLIKKLYLWGVSPQLLADWYKDVR